MTQQGPSLRMVVTRMDWILQNQVSARRLELNKIIFRQIAPTLYDLVVLKDQVY